MSEQIDTGGKRIGPTCVCTGCAVFYVSANTAFCGHKKWMANGYHRHIPGLSDTTPDWCPEFSRREQPAGEKE